MNRPTARQIAVQLVFSMETNHISAEEALKLFFDEEHYSSLREEDPIFLEMPDEAQFAYITDLVLKVESNLPEIDKQIERYSDSWKVKRLTKSTLAILRCAVCEICYMEDIPNSAAINEAVEMGKVFDSPQAAAFINGVLGSIVRSQDNDLA